MNTAANDNTTTRRTFLVGASYSTRSICDYDCIFSITILSRTDKTVTVAKSHGKVKRCKITTWEDGIETIKPWGSYSMCPIITAEKMVA